MAGPSPWRIAASIAACPCRKAARSPATSSAAPITALSLTAPERAAKSRARTKCPPARVSPPSRWWSRTGDAAKADPAAIPAHVHHRDPRWEWAPIFLEVNCDWRLLNDNLLDLTHLGFVHQKTIGGDPGAHAGAEMRVERKDH